MILITDDLDQEIERTLEKVSALGDCMILEFIYILFLLNVLEQKDQRGKLKTHLKKYVFVQTLN